MFLKMEVHFRVGGHTSLPLLTDVSKRVGTCWRSSKTPLCSVYSPVQSVALCYRLWVKSGSIEVVYCAELARWARQFVCGPWGASGAWHAYHSVRDSTKARLMTHWEDMMRANPVCTL